MYVSERSICVHVCMVISAYVCICVWLCMYVCICKYACVCMCAYVGICVNASACVHMYMRECISVNMYGSVWACVYVYMYAWILERMGAYVCMWKRVCVHVYACMLFGRVYVYVFVFVRVNNNIGELYGVFRKSCHPNAPFQTVGSRPPSERENYIMEGWQYFRTTLYIQFLRNVKQISNSRLAFDILLWWLSVNKEEGCYFRVMIVALRLTTSN